MSSSQQIVGARVRVRRESARIVRPSVEAPARGRRRVGPRPDRGEGARRQVVDPVHARGARQIRSRARAEVTVARALVASGEGMSSKSAGKQLVDLRARSGKAECEERGVPAQPTRTPSGRDAAPRLRRGGFEHALDPEPQRHGRTTRPAGHATRDSRWSRHRAGFAATVSATQHAIAATTWPVAGQQRTRSHGSTSRRPRTHTRRARSRAPAGRLACDEHAQDHDQERVDLHVERAPKAEVVLGTPSVPAVDSVERPAPPSRAPRGSPQAPGPNSPP